MAWGRWEIGCLGILKYLLETGRIGIGLLIRLVGTWGDDVGVCSSIGLRPTWTGVRRIRFRRPQAEALADGLT